MSVAQLSIDVDGDGEYDHLSRLQQRRPELVHVKAHADATDDEDSKVTVDDVWGYGRVAAADDNSTRHCIAVNHQINNWIQSYRD